MEELSHHSEKLIVKLVVELVVEILIRSPSKGLNDVVYGLSDKFFYLSVVLGRAIGGVNICHKVDEEMWNLVDEFQGFAILEHHFLLIFLLVLLFLPVALFVILPPIHLEVRILHILRQPQQKLGLFLEKFKELEVVLLGVKGSGVGSGLLALVDLLDQGIYSLAGLDSHILVLLDEVGVELVEKSHIVLRGDEVALQNLEDSDLILGGLLIFGEGG